MNNKVTRKTPNELVSKIKKQPFSTRIKVETYKTLKQIAREVGTSLSDLSAGILDDYVHWYEEEKRAGKKTKK